MDGAKPSSISASELYAGIGTAKTPLAVDAQRTAAVNANQGVLHRAQFLAARPHRPMEPGSAARACRSGPAGRH
jgi:hypothetical protein